VSEISSLNGLRAVLMFETCSYWFLFPVHAYGVMYVSCIDINELVNLPDVVHL
jgi:hypothetical protein